MDPKFSKPYSPKESEDRIYELWEKSGFFNPDVCVDKGVTKPDAEPFSMMVPPPNVTGTLHLGHAFEETLQDIVVRFNRMRGKKTLWLPGTDHAAIATEAKVEGMLLKKEKKSRHDLGREAFLERVTAFAQESHDTIVNQIKKLGASLDWSREAYTLDEARSRAVREAFVRMYNEGLIYRGSRIVNWDPKLQTNVSDDEIVWVEETTPFYYLKYGPFTIGTARPETKFGDKYVVMHPDDTRYKQYEHGQQIELEWINGFVTATIIKDEAIDMEFGTGVMTITPWHDATDYDIAERHGLEKEQIIDLKGKLLPIAGEFAGEHISKARPRIVEKLNAKGLLERVDENYVHRVATNDRGGGLIEPQIREQWFVDVNKEFTLPHSGIEGIAPGSTTSLKKLMLQTVKSGHITIIPERFEKVYFYWIENLRDWCISRQIWFGHRIPVWYLKQPTTDNRQSTTITYVGVEPPDDIENWEQDPDTLDTWFSSGLWTFSTLGWTLDSASSTPEKTTDLKTFHPTTIIMPGYEILFFWVARMILMTGFLLGDIPFKTAYLHGIVRGKDGAKYSKSQGTGGDPLDVIEQYGADALRMALTVGVGPGNDSRFEMEKVKGYKHFANKLWNITRFVLSNTEDYEPSSMPEIAPVDRVYLDALSTLADEVTRDIEKLTMHLASEKLYHYVWHEFADRIIEDAKSRLSGEDVDDRKSAQYMLLSTLVTCLKLLHPFMPFITEEIWQSLPREQRDAPLLLVARWPEH